jgi:hypothetical protein
MTGVYESSTTDVDMPVSLLEDSPAGGPEEDESFVADDIPRILSNMDFQYVAKIDLSPENLEILDVPDLFTSPFSFDDVAPHVFHNIRLRFGFKSAEYFASLAPAPFLTAVLDNQEFSSGRSGSFMCYSPNRRILMKTIPDHEASTMKRILPAYYAHVETNPKTLLIPILGLYSLRLSGAPKLHIIVMANLFSHELMVPNMVYDLKGSWVDRGGSAPRGTGGKDNDLRSPLNMAFRDAAELYAQLDADSRMLSQENVMDYSLLVGVCDPNGPQSKRGNSYAPPRNLKKSRRSDINGSPTEAPPHLTQYTVAELAAGGMLSEDDDQESPLTFPVGPSNVEPSHATSPRAALGQDTSLSPILEDIAFDHSKDRKFSPYGKEDLTKSVRTTTATVIHSPDLQQVYIIGIIDILQSYTLTKKIERFIKVYLRCKSAEGLSATKPVIYQDRFRLRMAHNVGYQLHSNELPV